MIQEPEEGTGNDVRLVQLYLVDKAGVFQDGNGTSSSYGCGSEHN